VNQPQLFMRLPELSDLPPAAPLEAGYTVREAVPADHEQLAEVLSEAFGDSWDAARVVGEFSTGNGVEATYVVVSPAGVVATAAARRLPDRYPEAGYVHYVGARSRERGIGSARWSPGGSSFTSPTRAWTRRCSRPTTFACPRCAPTCGSASCPSHAWRETRFAGRRSSGS